MKRIVTDQLDRKVVVPLEPRRVISLVPSLTEYLLNLKLESRLIGVTRYCTRPRDVLVGRDSIGGTKKFDFEKIAALKPDLIIANKEENYQSGIEQLAENYPVWVSDINDLNDALSAMQSIADLVNETARGQKICTIISRAFEAMPSIPKNRRPRVCYFIWRNPWMVCGSNNFIDDMLTRAGFVNVFADHPDRYPAITVNKIADLEPDFLFLSSEPFPFDETHVEELKHLLPLSESCIVDAEPFSWYGSRLLYSAQYLSGLHEKCNSDNDASSSDESG